MDDTDLGKRCGGLADKKNVRKVVGEELGDLWEESELLATPGRQPATP